MGLEVVVEDENGNKIESYEDSRNVLHVILPKLDNGSYVHLNNIDWYGDTVFNENQIKGVIIELYRLTKTYKTEEELLVLKKIIDLAEKCKIGPHLYLKFYGD